jgi:pimeloyl-ACP methyl ester carboxylesterase
MQSEFDLGWEDVERRGLPLRRSVISGSQEQTRRALICIPGFSASGRSFARLAPLAETCDLHFIAPPLDVSYPGDPVLAQAEVVAEYLSAFDRPVLLGTSFGGLVSLRAASMVSEQLAGLVLVGAFARGTGLIPKALPFMRHVLPVMQAAAAPLSPVTAQVVGGGKIDRAGRRMIVEDTRAIPARERARRLRTIFRTDLSPLLAEIDIPTLVIHGTSDRLVPVNLAKEMSELLPRATYHEIHGCGHLPYVTHPDEVLRLLTEFFARVIPQSPLHSPVPDEPRESPQ